MPTAARWTSVALLLMAFVWPTVASADDYNAVAQAYDKAGTIKTCQFSNRQLEIALKQAPTYDVEYFGGLTAAIQSTMEEQAGGGCHHSGRAVAIKPETSPLPRTPAPPRSVTAGTGAGIPLPLALALALAILGVLVGSGVALTRLTGWEPAWAELVRHSWGEAGYRVSGTWAEFRDWLRA
jgi:hypothetical protein